jgi:hypothetical protein
MAEAFDNPIVEATALSGTGSLLLLMDSSASNDLATARRK